ncbi:hypothetical protein FB45DRAFT_960194 [Roridomyces roridus]|uniref:Uncharacterized protein n=1 Tax=Roridomyces roridus TaxID=1738132 RepID=A0AAD7AYE9_9AGAR|nr:hypothetical protein FB45DRAFT_960194 [Roridomyces roridus]
MASRYASHSPRSPAAAVNSAHTCIKNHIEFVELEARGGPEGAIGSASFTMVHLSRLLLTASLIGTTFACETTVQRIHSDWREIALRIFDLDAGVKAFPASGNIHGMTMNLVFAFDRGTVDLQDTEPLTNLEAGTIFTDIPATLHHFNHSLTGFARKKTVFAAHGLSAVTLTGLKALNESTFAYGLAVDRAVPVRHSVWLDSRTDTSAAWLYKGGLVCHRRDFQHHYRRL